MFGLNSKKDNGIGAELDMGSLVRRHELESGQSEGSDESDHLTQANHIAKVIGNKKKSGAAAGLSKQQMTFADSK